MAPSFDEKKFKEENPVVHDRFLVEKTALSRSFSLARKTRPLSELCPELVSQTEEYNSKLQEDAQFTDPPLKRNGALEKLHEEYLQTMRQEHKVSFKKDLLEAKIKAACGAAKGIEGVCTWNRIQKKTTGFNATALAEDEPELHQKYLFERGPTHSLNVNLMRSYPLG